MTRYKYHVMTAALAVFFIACFAPPAWATYLRQSTAVPTLLVGPFVDPTDGVTPVTAITPGAQCVIFKNGVHSHLTLTTVGAGVNDFVHEANGYWILELTTGDTDTLGKLIVSFNDPAVFMPVWAEFEVIDEPMYDSLFVAATPMTVVIKDGTGTGEIDTDAGHIVAVHTTDVATSATSVTNEVTVGAISNNVITTASIADSAITDAKVADAVKVDTVTIKGVDTDTALDTTDEVVDAVWNEPSTGHLDAGKAGLQLWTDIDDILTDTGSTLDTKLNTIDDFVDTEVADILTDTGTTLDDLVDDLETRITSARAGYLDALNTGVPLADGVITANKIATDAIDADALAADAIGASEIATAAITSAEMDLTGSEFTAIPTVANVTTVDTCTNATTCGTCTALGTGAVSATAIANGAIDNDTFAADVGSTPYATNIIALAADKAILNYDPPTNTEMEARTLPSADYVVTTDTIAGVTSVTGIAGTTNTFDELTALLDTTDTMVDAVWNELMSGHTTDATFGGDAFDADVWTSTKAGYIDEAISGIDDNPWDAAARTLTAFDEDTFGANLDLNATIAAGTWNALKASYNTVDTFGDQPTVGEISADVWSTDKDSPTADSYGWLLNMLLNFAWGRMKINTTTNVMTYYDYDDRTSSVGSFYLYDDTTPTRALSHTNTYERDTTTP